MPTLRLLGAYAAAMALLWAAPAVVAQDEIPGSNPTKAKQGAVPAFDATGKKQEPKKKKERCVSGETAEVASYKLDEGSHLPHAINRSLTGKPGDPEKGVAWIVNRRQGNCIACHTIPKILERANPDNLDSMRKYGFHGKIAPSLDGVASRYTEGELRLLVVNPKLAFPNTIMPAFHKADGFHRVHKDCEGLAILSAERVEDIVAFLKTMK